MKYTINVIEQLRQKEKTENRRRSTMNIVAMISVGLLLVSIGWAVRNVLSMRLTIEQEEQVLARIEAEYSKYRSTRMIVDKSDIELLDRLQTQRIFWTKKLAAMAYHLPNKPPNPYWITSFGYKRNMLNVKGFGYISREQEQLITIDDYLTHLRNDSTYNDVFGVSYLNEATRKDEGSKERISFEYTSVKTRGGRR